MQLETECRSARKNLLTLVREMEIDPTELGVLFGTFKSKQQAIVALRKIAEAHQLCPRLLGLEPAGIGACFASQIKRCKGACCGRESPEIHHLRLQQALIPHKLKAWPYAGKIGIREQNTENAKTQLHVFEHWTYLGMVENDADLSDKLAEKSAEKATFKFDLDTYKILLKAFNQPKTHIVPLSAKSDS